MQIDNTQPGKHSTHKEPSASDAQGSRSPLPIDLHQWLPLLLLTASGLILTFSFASGLVRMVAKWNKEEYSHAVIIPFISIFLIIKKLPELSQALPKHQWFGVVMLAGAFLLWLAGEFSSIFIIVEYAYLMAIVALITCFIGLNGTKIIWVALAYLVFMIPLPNFIYNNLSSELQLISSQLGVFVVRSFGISVFLEGNVIDLGAMKLQVVDACSGLRYLFPLMSFGFLVCALMRGPFWHKALLFVSTIPITVLMNSFRIGVIGITVEYFGIAAAEGFLHDFEGWVVFMACLFLLFTEMLILHKVSKSKISVWEKIDLNLPDPLLDPQYLKAFGNISKPALAAITCILLSLPLGNMIESREEQVPERLEFTSLPLILGSWMGRESSIDADVIDVLKVTDYLMVDYSRLSDGFPVNFYVAYYASQRKGASIHSPRSCIPGGGWQITSSANHQLSSIPINSAQGPLMVNRVIAEKEGDKMLVYYWFMQRGKNITNEYAAKWHIFWDALTMNRTDGALIRVTTLVQEGSIEEADKELESFVAEFHPLLNDYIPN